MPLRRAAKANQPRLGAGFGDEIFPAGRAEQFRYCGHKPNPMQKGPSVTTSPSEVVTGVNTGYVKEISQL